MFCSPSLPMSPLFILLILFCCLSSCSFPISSLRAALIELPRCLFYTVTCVQSPFHMQCSLWVTITIKYSSEYSWQMLISNVCDCIAPVYWGDLASFWAHKTFITLGWRLPIISNVGIWQRASNSWSELDWKQENGQSNVIKINKYKIIELLWWTKEHFLEQVVHVFISVVKVCFQSRIFHFYIKVRLTFSITPPCFFMLIPAGTGQEVTSPSQSATSLWFKENLLTVTTGLMF